MEQVTTLPPLPPRAVDGHKGDFGRVLIIGGHEQMIGAPVLAGTAALRMGAGLVQIAVPQTILPAAISITPELIGLGLRSSRQDRHLMDAAMKCDALVIGPGMGQSDDARERLAQLIKLPKPAVIDADALNLLAAGEVWPAGFNLQAVLTPHPGEMKRLGKLIGKEEVPTDDAGRIEMAVEASKVFGQIIVLKGHRTVVAQGDVFYLNQTGDSSLSKAGTGDVLSGIIGCLLGQNVPPFQAAIIGVYLHGKAGELAGEKLGMRCVLARDVIESLPAAIGDYEKTKQGMVD